MNLREQRKSHRSIASTVTKRPCWSKDHGFAIRKKILLAVAVYPVDHLGTKLIRPIFICARSSKRNPST